jgi:hypothetical protein
MHRFLFRLTLGLTLAGLCPTCIRAQGRKEPVFQGLTASEWGRLLHGPNVVERRAAARALLQGPQMAEAAVPFLQAALEDPDESVRSLSVRALGKVGAAAWCAVPALIRALQDKEEDVRPRPRRPGRHPRPDPDLPG